MSTAALASVLLSSDTFCSSEAMVALVVSMLELICDRWYLAWSYCWLSADISFWACWSDDSMAAAFALASEMASPAAGRVRPNTVLDNTVTTARAGTATRWSTEVLRPDRGVEWLAPSTSVTMGVILIGGPRAIQTPWL